ncbi:MAG: hypothetical protein WCH61_05265 [bacterium]
MMTKFTSSVRWLLLLTVAGSPLWAQDSGFAPVQLSLFNPVQVPGDHYSVIGLRLNLLYGKSHEMSGLDLGVFNKT